MSGTTRFILFPFTALLLLFAIFWFRPLSHLASPIVAKHVSSFEQQQDSSLFETNIYQDVYYAAASKNQEDDDLHRDNNPVVDEKDVVVLTDKNFSDFIARNPFVMVNFYASWCFWSRKLLPEYSAAATILKGEAVLAKVDASEERKLSTKYHIQGYPTMSLFVNGVPKVDYYGERKRDAIAAWVRQKKGPAVQTVTTTEEAESILANSVIVVGFLDTLEGPDAVELAAAPELHARIDFYQTTNVDVARLLGINPQIKRPALVMLKWEVANRSLIDFDGEFNRSAISDFVSVNKDVSVITVTPADAPRLFKFPMKQLWLFAPKHSWELISAFKEAAKIFKQKLLFLYVETTNEPVGHGAKMAHRLGLADGASGIVAYVGNGHAKHIYHGELTLSGIKSFIEEFLENKLSTQSVPTSKTVLRLPSDSHLSGTSLVSS